MKTIVDGIERFRYMMNTNPHVMEVSKEEFDKQLLKFNVIRESWGNADVLILTAEEEI